MQLDLFARTSDKSELQRALDRNRAAEETATLQEPPSPVPATQACTISKPLFKCPRNPENAFQVDLLSGWLKS